MIPNLRPISDPFEPRMRPLFRLSSRRSDVQPSEPKRLPFGDRFIRALGEARYRDTISQVREVVDRVHATGASPCMTDHARRALLVGPGTDHQPEAIVVPDPRPPRNRPPDRAGATHPRERILAKQFAP